MKGNNFLITLQDKNKVSREGKIFDLWAFHQEDEFFDEPKFTVTHMPTGVALLVFNDLKPAREFVYRMSRTKFPIDWDSFSFDFAAYKRNAGRVYRIFKEVEDKFGIDILHECEISNWMFNYRKRREGWDGRGSK